MNETYNCLDSRSLVNDSVQCNSTVNTVPVKTWVGCQTLDFFFYKPTHVIVMLYRSSKSTYTNMQPLGLFCHVLQLFWCNVELVYKQQEGLAVESPFCLVCTHYFCFLHRRAPVLDPQSWILFRGLFKKWMPTKILVLSWRWDLQICSIYYWQNWRLKFFC